MINMRLFPPSIGTKPTITVNGRTYSAALGGTVDVQQVDAQVMLANGWTKAADAVGNTAQRLAATPFQGMQWHDTNLNLTVVHEGAVWRNPATGASV